MKSHKWLTHALMRGSGSVRRVAGKPSTGRAGGWATRGMFVMALALSVVVAFRMPWML
jgi:hypothetical protein